MAVKKHELVAENRNQLDLATLAQYLHLMNEQQYMPPTQELVKHCQDIVKCLARTAGTVDQLWQLLQPIEHFLLRVVTSVHCDVRHEIFTAILDKFYSYISDPQSDACPATAAVLIVIDETDEATALSIARCLVQRMENGPAGAGPRAALSCLYSWLHEWPCAPALGFWSLAYIKALEESVHHDILIETSLGNLTRLFSCLITQKPIHRNTANVIFHVLVSLRESVEAFDRISSMVGKVLVNLASESGQWSRQVLQDLVDILTAMVDRITSSLKGDAQEMFRDKYADVILCLERHMASRASKFLQLPAWCPVKFCPSRNNNVPTRKVGLENLGNTCYMNSIVQALLVARQFSTHVMLKALTIPYWEKVGELFAHMTHSVSSKLDPDKFFRYLRPPHFTMDNQHDSYEFLGYLFQLLHSYEHSKETNHDYTKPPVLNGSRMRAILPSDEQTESGQSRRSASPRPCSSKGSGSSGVKRNYGEALPCRKRPRTSEGPSRQRQSETASVIDALFGGVLLTRVQCTVCHASSLSRDACRDLQLAFPEKPEGRQHSVQGLLEFFCSKESLTGDNKYHCRDCGELRDAERSVLIETTPKYLVIVLKNFKFDAKLKVETKLMHSVYYNHTLTLPTVRAQTTHAAYTLFAAVIHSGSTLDSGHYYTLAKDNDQWHQYNDCVVTHVDEGHLNRLNKTSTPYILLYRRSDVEEPSAPTIEELPARVRDDITSNNKRYIESVRKLRGRQ